MAECSLGECGISCEFGCTCGSAGSGCSCDCENQTLPPFSTEGFRLKLKGVKRSDPELLIDFVASDMSVVSLAEWFEWLFPGQVMVPVSKMREKFSTDGVIEQIKLGDLMERIGLVRATAELIGRDLPDEPGHDLSSGCCGS
jgi:hypothetical protein